MGTININIIINSNSVNFSMMIELKEVMEFEITSHVSYFQIITKEINLELLIYGKSNCLFQAWWFSPLHPRCTIEYQYSCQYSYEYLSTCPRVRVLLLWNLRVRVKYEYQKFSTRVLRVRVLSTSTPSLVTAVASRLWPDIEGCALVCACGWILLLG